MASVLPDMSEDVGMPPSARRQRFVALATAAIGLANSWPHGRRGCRLEADLARQIGCGSYPQLAPEESGHDHELSTRLADISLSKMRVDQCGVRRLSQWFVGDDRKHDVDRFGISTQCLEAGSAGLERVQT